MRRRIGGTVAAIALLALGGGCLDEVERDESGEIVEAGDLTFDSLRAGDCFNDPEGILDEEGTEVATLDGVPCSEPHDNEVFGVVTHPAGDDDPWPGGQALFAYGQRTCLEYFEPFVGVPYGNVPLDYATFAPLEDAWGDGHRVITCFLYDVNLGDLTGSMEGAGASVAAGAAIPILALNVGDCFDDPQGMLDGVTPVLSVDPVPCDEPHDNEVFAVFEYPARDDAEWPGAEAVDNYVYPECLDRFETYIEVAYEDSLLDYFPFTPTEQTWLFRGDHRVSCVLYDFGLGKLTGSMEGSGQ